MTELRFDGRVALVTGGPAAGSAGPTRACWRHGCGGSRGVAAHTARG